MTAPATPKRRFSWLACGIVIGAVALVFLFLRLRVPSDRTPEGAYLRVVKAVLEERPERFFAYLEDPAQHACYTIRDYRKQSLARASKDYPASELVELKKRFEPFANVPDGADVFARYARDEGWLEQLRVDLSGVAEVRSEGDRATIVTAKGTRYSFRKRPNGIWGMTAFTPFLVDEAERAARDHALVEKAASDFARAHGATR